MVSLQDNKLPYLFAVMDPAPSLPSRYYVFMSYEDTNPHTLTVNNMAFSKPLMIQVNDANQAIPYKTKVSYSGTQNEVIFWKIGIDIISEENERIPVIDFKRQLLLPSLRNRPVPVYVTPDSIVSKSQHQTIFREHRTQMMGVIAELVRVQTYIQLPSPPAIQRIHPALDETVISREPAFTLPRHAATIFIKALIDENKSCCITTNPFNEISLIGITPCFHCFEFDAVETWLSSHRTCPECRAPVNSIVKYTR